MGESICCPSGRQSREILCGFNKEGSGALLSFLLSSCIVLTSSKEGKLDPVIGRDQEIRRTLQVLSRRTKNNPCLIGEAGVGKTAIIEGTHNRIHIRIGHTFSHSMCCDRCPHPLPSPPSLSQGWLCGSSTAMSLTASRARG